MQTCCGKSVSTHKETFSRIDDIVLLVVSVHVAKQHYHAEI